MKAGFLTTFLRADGKDAVQRQAEVTEEIEKSTSFRGLPSSKDISLRRSSSVRNKSPSISKELPTAPEWVIGSEGN